MRVLAETFDKLINKVIVHFAAKGVERVLKYVYNFVKNFVKSCLHKTS
jgi:hypothetical protein